MESTLTIMPFQLPRKSLTRNEKEGAEQNAKVESRINGKRNVSEKEAPQKCVNASVLGNAAIKTEPLEEGEIPESPSKVSISSCVEAVY